MGWEELIGGLTGVGVHAVDPTLYKLNVGENKADLTEVTLLEGFESSTSEHVERPSRLEASVQYPPPPSIIHNFFLVFSLPTSN